MHPRIILGHPLLNADKPLRHKPVIHHIKDFDEESGKHLAEAISKATANQQGVLPIVVDSFGGDVYGLLSIIEEIKAAPIPIATIVRGKAMSCGAMLAALGTRGMRYIGPHSHILIHHISSSHMGITPSLKEDQKQTSRLEKQVFEMVDKNCGHKPGYFLGKLKPMEGADWYITPREAVNLGLVDHIKIPEFRVDISVEMGLF